MSKRIDLSDRAEIRLVGRDARKLLHNLSTNEVNQRSVGEGAEAFLLNAKGWILDHFTYFVGPLDEPESPPWIDLDAPPGRAAALLKHLDRYIIREDVKLMDAGPGRALIHLGGAGTLELVRELLGGLLPENPAEYAHGVGAFAGGPITWRRMPRGLAEGIDLKVPNAASATLRAELARRGTSELGAGEFDRLRLRAGIPLVGREIGEMNLAQEMDRDRRAISFTKGCYLGQETVARLDAHGHVNKLLRGITLATAQPIETPAKVTLGGKELGTLTSAAAPTPGATEIGADDPDRTIGLAILRTFGNAVGTEVQVETAAGPIAGTVTAAQRA